MRSGSEVYSYLMTHAAFFDLDRTVIAGSSAQVFGQMLRDMGVDMPAPPGQAGYFQLYQRFGEDPVTMRIARYAARLFAGHSVLSVAAAGRMAADVLASDLLPGAQVELKKRRAGGASLVLATTAPHELAAPFAEAAGFDDLLCTRYRSVDGIYDGTNESDYVWGEDKAAAVATWAGAHSVDLTQSYAYSDSFYDVPMLELVGNPVVVNADVRLTVLARVRNWSRRRWEPSDTPPVGVHRSDGEAT